MHPPKRDTGPNALRRGRMSLAYADYFVTVCVQSRRAALVPDVAHALLTEAQRIATDGHWVLRSLTVMPDHVHILFTLGSGLSLAQAVARFKSKTRLLIRAHAAEWQANFYDHRIRAEDSIEDVVRYIYLNPYRAGLISRDERWPYFFCCDEDWAWFRDRTDHSRPFPEWLQ